jgi:hypothetical protein
MVLLQLGVAHPTIAIPTRRASSKARTPNLRCGRSVRHPQLAGLQPDLEVGALRVRIDHALLGSGFQLLNL